MEEYHLCNVCGLNRATLHLDEVVDGTIQLTAHLCDDCWYRLGIRIPLGNIWRHIHLHREQEIPPLHETSKDLESLLAETDLGELLDTSPLAVAEPGESTGEGVDFRSLLEAQEDTLVDKDAITGSPPSSADLGDISRTLGIDAVRVDAVHPTLVTLVPIKMLRGCKAIPVKLEGERLVVAFADPFNVEGIEGVRDYLMGLNLTLVIALADEHEILRELNRHSGPPRRFDPLS